MVLFCCNHLSALSQIVALRFSRYEDAQVVLMLNTDLINTDFCQRLIQNGVFDYGIGTSDGLIIQADTVAKAETTILDYYNSLFIKEHIKLNNFSDIIVASDIDNDFAIYLSIKNIKYIAFELYEGQFLQTYRYEVCQMYAGATQSCVDTHKKHLALCGESPYVKYRFLYKTEHTVEEFANTNDIYIDFPRLLSSLNCKQKQLIIDCFDNRVTGLASENTCLLLPNSVGYVMPKTNIDFDNICLVYQILVDYYSGVDRNSLLFIKEHPSDSPNFKKFFNDAVVLEKYLPVEFYTLIDNFKISNCLSAMTTSIDKMSNYIANSIAVGDSYYYNFRLCHQLFVAFSLSKLLCNFNTNNHYHGIDYTFLKTFANTSFNLNNYDPLGIRCDILKDNIYTIINTVEHNEQAEIITALINADNDTMVVFLNTDKTHPFVSLQHKELLEYVVPIIIKKLPIRNDILENLNDEVIYFFCKDRHIREQVKSFSLTKILKYTGIELCVLPCTDDIIENNMLKVNIEHCENEIVSLKHRYDILEQRFDRILNAINNVE